MLLTSELTTNAVVHASSDVEIRVVCGVGVTVEVRDRSDRPPSPRRHVEDSVCGRGLELVELLADSFGVVPIPGYGKSVWFSLGNPGAKHLSQRWPATPASARKILSLLCLPLGLYAVLQEHNEALLREYTLQLLENPTDNLLSLKDVVAAEHSRLSIATSVSKLIAEQIHPASHADVSIEVSSEDETGFELLPSVIESAEAQARAGNVLTPPAPSDLVTFRNWLFGQVRSQLDGDAPTAWTR